MYLYSWNPKSESGTALAKGLGIRKIRHENSAFKGSKDKTVINWGSSKLPDEVLKSNVLNKPNLVGICSNKLSFFKAVSNGKVSIPDWTTDPKQAFAWVAEGRTVCARQVLQGHSAEGLVLMTKDPQTHVEAPLYTKYIPKIDEYRVHILNGKVIDIQKKALRKDWQEQHGEPNFKIRNLANGFIFMREGINPPAQVTEQSLNAIGVIGLDFGAVDVIWNQQKQMAYVLEINTAPGLEGTTLENYIKAFKE